ncbi:MAG TPA: hypothetical protein VEY07_08560 [Thermoplasmata archaeon]|nr:hypothetical protein [Thermoplasmata archaeon]
MASSRSPFLPRLDGEERQKAIEDPGPSWREWFFFSFAKVWTLLAFFIIDVFVFVTFADPFVVWALVPSMALAIYGEYLLYEFLWFRPPLEKISEWRREFHPTWFRPVRFGRWTVEGERVRAGGPLLPPGEEPYPDPNEFL